MIKHIVVATDGSDHGQRAVEWAARLASDTKATVTLVHIVPPPPSLAGVYAVSSVGPMMEDQRKEAEANCPTWGQPLTEAGVAWDCRIGEGQRAEAIAQIARSVHADLIVVGSRGLHGISGAIRGSTSHAVASHSAIPVVIVPHPMAAMDSSDPEAPAVVNGTA